MEGKKRRSRGRKNGAPVEEKQHIRMEEQPVPQVKEPGFECAICGKSIDYIAEAISEPDGRYSHFDCVMDKLRAQENVREGEKLSYIGHGCFAVFTTDENGKYAPMSGDFTLTTDDIPVKYSDGKLIKVDVFSDEDVANYIKNIASVEVNGTAYNAAGKRSVKIVGEDGTLDFDVKSGENNVFDGSGNYTVKITATGYTKPLEFEIKPEAETTAATSKTSTSNTSATTSKSTSSGATTNPKTGVPSAAAPLAVLALAGAAAFALRKKNS